ncbi:hypothetical protein [Flavobacterium daejeonense]|uniref:hypothetical protein n=1 Tax=Flavobacterium daejeonense TaxID=350893 RepID=UPI000A4BA53C|nr:hypothetical protein [Flavobacterium daejeonense]
MKKISKEKNINKSIEIPIEHQKIVLDRMAKAKLNDYWIEMKSLNHYKLSNLAPPKL